ncbi:hypothetical protein VM1G_04903 [Cytospora mali]|uniref:Vacuolar membrane protein n=1 Tax=Cytospora mali TaxID=578113 RepID=A0A194VZK0_CYTMA|nr:hypothetical protein VM1G_04903 [Valsa mali]
MGFFSGRSKDEVRPEQKWDFIQLNDFKAESAFTYVAYGYLYFSLIISTAVYSVDSFTAINLLAFNKWSSEIQPAVSFDITKWVFAICIILSFVNLIYEHIRAHRIMKRGSVAESYLDNLAVRLESTRMGSGKGWRRFLVFAELTKSKKGAEYIALFTYFSFQSWFRVIFCSGPRQAVNGLTLYSVLAANLSADGASFETGVVNSWDKFKTIAEQDYRQALILSGMLFTSVIWIFSIMSLMTASMFFVFFLWGWIPREDSGLSGYCERKINKRLMKIVSSKIDAAIADQERQRKKAELIAARKAGGALPEERKATLPNIMPSSDEKVPGMPMINRNDTMATLPMYTSRPATPNGGGGEGFEMPVLTRTGTSTSTTSSRAPLLQSGAEMGRSSPAPPMPPLPTLPPMKSSMAGGHPPLQRVQTNQSSFGGSYTQTPSPYSPENSFPSMPQPVQSSASAPMGPYGMPPRSNTAQRGTFDDYFSTGRASPAPMRPMPPRPTLDDYNNGANAYSQRGQTQSPRPMGPPSQGPPRGYPAGGPGGYPMRNATGPLPNRGSPGTQQQRNVTAPVPQPGMQRQGTGEFRSLTPAQQGPSSPEQPRRNMTAPAPQPGIQRQGTAPISQAGIQRPGTAPLPQPGIQRQGTGEFRSLPPVQQNPYSEPNGYFDAPASPQAYNYPGPPPAEYLNRPGTAHSQRSMDTPPQLNRQPTYGSEREMNSPQQLSRRPTYGSEDSVNSPSQSSQNPAHGNGWMPDLEGQRGPPGPRY